MALDDLLPDSDNPRVINPASEARLYGSYDDFGQMTLPVFNKRTGQLVGGHQGTNILRRQGYTHTMVVVKDFDPDDQAAANMALNAPYGTWDDEKLEARLRRLQGGGYDLDRTSLPPFQIADILQRETYQRPLELKAAPSVADILKSDTTAPTVATPCSRCSLDADAPKVWSRSDGVSRALCPDCDDELMDWFANE